MPARSLYKKCVCSVTIVFIPNNLATMRHIFIVIDVLKWPCTISICSRINIYLSNGNIFNGQKNETSFLSTGSNGKW